jgi:two-component sensor histidine kinase
MQEEHHRVANNLSLIAALIRLQKSAISRKKRQFSEADVGVMLAVVAGRIDAVGAMHRAMAEAAGASQIDLSPVIRAMCEPLVSSLAPPGAIALALDLEPDCKISIDHAVPIALIIGEAVANSLRHSQPTGVAGRLRIASHHEAKRTLLIEIVDDGVGLPEGFDLKAGGEVGFKIIRALSKQINAKFTLDSGSTGLRLLLRVPPGPARRKR